MSVVEYPNEIVLRGYDALVDDWQALLYEKTTSDIEFVLGAITQMGTADNQVKIWAGGTVQGLFVKQSNWQPIVGRSPDNNYAEDGKPVTVKKPKSRVLVLLRLKNAEVIVKGDPIEPESGTGYVQKQVGGPTIGEAGETLTASDTNTWLKVWLNPAAF